MKVGNLKLFLVYLASILAAICLINLTIYLAKQAQVNTGLIVSLFSLNPILASIFDWYLFGAKLSCC